MTVKDQNGKVVYSEKKPYTVHDMFFGGEAGKISFQNYDPKSVEHIDQGIKPLTTESKIFIANLPEDIKTADVEVSFNILYGDSVATLSKVNKKMEVKK